MLSIIFGWCRFPIWYVLIGVALLWGLSIASVYGDIRHAMGKAVVGSLPVLGVVTLFELGMWWLGGRLRTWREASRGR